MMDRQVISTSKAPKELAVYSQAVKARGFIFVAGQIAVDPATGKLVEGGIAAQTQQVLRNIKTILEAGGSSLDHIVKVTAFLASVSDFPEYNKAYGEFFTEGPPPARITVGAQIVPGFTEEGGVLPGVLLEIDAIAIVPE